MKRIKIATAACMAWRASLLLAALTVLVLPARVYAGIVASSTRLIMTQQQPSLSVILANTNDYPIMVQTWIDDGSPDSTPEKASAPFIPLPAVFRMQPGAVQGLRVINKQDERLRALPADRESVFWLNLYEIPPKNPKILRADVHVAMAMNTQMKVFYRPVSLVGAPDNIIDKLQFSLIKNGDHYSLRCHNKSAFHASFGQMTLVAGGARYPLVQEMDMMTAPFSQRDYQINSPLNVLPVAPISLELVLFDDDGAARKSIVALSQ